MPWIHWIFVLYKKCTIKKKNSWKIESNVELRKLKERNQIILNCWSKVSNQWTYLICTNQSAFPFQINKFFFFILGSQTWVMKQSIPVVEANVAAFSSSMTKSEVVINQQWHSCIYTSRKWAVPLRKWTTNLLNLLNKNSGTKSSISVHAKLSLFFV